VQSIQVAKLKSNFSDILKMIKVDGEKFIIQYGKSHEKIAMLIPYDQNLEREDERVFGLYSGKGSFKMRDDFEMSDEELLGL